MQQDTPQNIYGILTLDLAATSKGARQFSPLLPGSSDLEEYVDASLNNMTMLAPFGTLERRYALAHVLRALAPGAQLIVGAPKDKGGSRLKQELIDFGCDVGEESRRHFRICTCMRPDEITGIDDAISNGAPRLLDIIGFWSQPGIFSWDRLDIGSELLANTLPMLSGAGADLGCGFGYLSRTVLKSPDIKQLALIDIDRRAVACAKHNIDDPRATFLWADVAISKPELNNLDFIVMNPPFHDAGIEDKALGQKFVERAHAMLRSDGVCWLTANRHLPYENLLNALYKKATLKTEANGYKIYEAVK